MWNLKDLVRHSSETNAEIDGQWVPARPVVCCLWCRIRDAVAVLRGRADAVKWPGGQ